jgi:hypothetical protein
MELPVFLEILVESPQAAKKIAFVAVSLGIPVGDEALGKR